MRFSMARDAKHLVGAPRSANTPKLGGAAVREIGIRTTGEGRGHPLTSQADSPMPDGKDSLVQGHQVAGIESVLDQSRAETYFDQLSPGDHPVLTLRQFSNHSRRHLCG